MEKLGIDKLKVVVGFMVNSAEGVDKALEDKKINLLDAPLLYPIVMQVGSAVSAGPEAFAQLKDLDAEESVEMERFVREELQLINVKVEAIIEDSLAVLVSVAKLISTIKTPAVVA